MRIFNRRDFECIAAQIAHEMQIFMKEKGVNPLKNLIVPLCQV